MVSRYFLELFSELSCSYCLEYLCLYTSFFIIITLPESLMRLKCWPLHDVTETHIYRGKENGKTMKAIVMLYLEHVCVCQCEHGYNRLNIHARPSQPVEILHSFWHFYIMLSPFISDMSSWGKRCLCRLQFGGIWFLHTRLFPSCCSSRSGRLTHMLSAAVDAEPVCD